MKTLDQRQLSFVAGARTADTQVTAALTNIQTSLRDLNSAPSRGSDMMPLLMMTMMMNRQAQPAIVAAPSYASVPAPSINISTNVSRRRGCWW